jgi:SAM-dependent methyltransferase
MKSQLQLLAKGLTPPMMWKLATFLKRLLTGDPPPIAFGERDAEWYNRAYRETEEYRKHYTQSQYYFIWTVVLDRLLRAGVSSVLDIGCGPGQFASLLRANNVPRYCGIDLSQVAIRLARSACPDYTFSAVNVFETDILEKLDYDTAISMEFLEHVSDDIIVLQRIPKGRRFIGSVPNFPYESHVRHFLNTEEVVGRYGSLFEQFHVDSFLADDKEKIFYLFEGIKA